MAKMLAAVGSAILPNTRNRSRTTPSLAAVARRVLSLIGVQKDKDIERFIRERGGVLSDDIERELSRTVSGL